mmetsp:Transcript_43991/g.113704  ORF Transcript_43991/g.113704 Transcript_43991/m.113704 type:complete len:282 (+) Transcript_43991:400-1245(+)
MLAFLRRRKQRGHLGTRGTVVLRHLQGEGQGNALGRGLGRVRDLEHIEPQQHRLEHLDRIADIEWQESWLLGGQRRRYRLQNLRPARQVLLVPQTAHPVAGHRQRRRGGASLLPQLDVAPALDARQDMPVKVEARLRGLRLEDLLQPVTGPGDGPVRPACPSSIHGDLLARCRDNVGAHHLLQVEQLPWPHLAATPGCLHAADRIATVHRVVYARIAEGAVGEVLPQMRPEAPATRGRIRALAHSLLAKKDVPHGELIEQLRLRLIFHRLRPQLQRHAAAC